MINIMIIPSANAYVEKIFTMVNVTKSDSRSLLDITTVNSTIQVEAYYDLDPKFEPTKEHYFCYRTNIK